MRRPDELLTRPAGIEGVLIDNLTSWQAVGGTVRRGRHRDWAVDGGRAWPILCGDIVERITPDGPVDGRCGQRVDGDRGACELHADARDAWQNLSEWEKLAIERAEDDRL